MGTMNATHHTLSLFLSEQSPPAAPLAVGGAGGISVVEALVLELGTALVVVAKVVWAEEPSFVTLVGSKLDDGEGVRVVEASDGIVEATLEAPETTEPSSDVRDAMALDTSDDKGVCVVIGVVRAVLGEMTGVFDVAAVVGRIIEEATSVEDGAEADKLAELAEGRTVVLDEATSELAGIGMITVVGTTAVPDEEPSEVRDDGMTIVVDSEGSTNDTEIDRVPEVAGGGITTVVGAEGIGIEISTELAGGGIRTVELEEITFELYVELTGGGMGTVGPEGTAVKLVAELVGVGGRTTIVVELADGSTTTGSEADRLELELGTDTEGAGYPTVCEIEGLGMGYGTRTELDGGAG
jgi:hypothetical protein